ncbi:ParA family protein [Pantanalinema sp. GBBB05]|uniref:ParA family protein n=1 Tax=Pantanalinema sp. GBBB05 TaxID=2604139 RepID=UPI001DCE5EA0|nr:ParA family protein [Pantanalinema sp. GBBB05]
MAVVTSIFNQAGGVAKSTLTLNLGYTLSQAGQRVLLVDFDPQGSLTVFLGFEPWDLPVTVYDTLMGNYSTKESLISVLEQAIVSAHQMDLLPANRRLGKAELELFTAMNRERKLAAMLDPLKDRYDWILIDCPPSLGLLSVSALTASNGVLVPVETEYKSWVGTDLLLETITLVRREINPGLSIFGFIPTKHTRTKSQHQRVLKAMREQLASVGMVFDPIPNATAFADASEAGQPLMLYDRRHVALQALQSLASTLLSTHTGVGELVAATDVKQSTSRNSSKAKVKS